MKKYLHQSIYITLLFMLGLLYLQSIGLYEICCKENLLRETPVICLMIYNIKKLRLKLLQYGLPFVSTFD